MPADRRGVQAERRDQPPAPALARGAQARGRGFLVRQPCARRGDRRAPPRHPGGDRDAGRCAAGEDRRHPQRGRRDHLLRAPHREPRSDCRQNLRGNRRHSRAELRRSDDRRRPGHRWAGNRRATGPVAAADCDPVRRGRARIGNCSGRARRRDRDRRARGLGRHGPLARAWRDRSGPRRRARHDVRRVADPARVADHVRHPAGTRRNRRWR